MRRRLTGTIVLLALALSAAGRAGAEPLTPERVVGEIRWKDDYTVEEVRRLVFSVASMYQDELDRAVREAVRPLRLELESLKEGSGQAGLTVGPAAGGAAIGAEAARPPAGGRARVERQLRIWQVIGVSAAVVGLVEAAVLLSR